MSFSSRIILVTTLTVVTNGFWVPEVTELGQQDIFQHVPLFDFEEDLIQTIADSLKEKQLNGAHARRFQWTSTTGLRESSTNVSWVILGGFVERMNTNQTKIPFVAEFVGVVGCRFTPDTISSPAFKFVACEIIELSPVLNEGVQDSVAQRVGLLGFSMNSKQCSSRVCEAALIYCDPLWRSDTVHPGGMCRIKLFVESSTTNKIELNKTLSFCSGSTHSTPCGGGYSLDILEQKASIEGTDFSNVSKFDLLLGMPFTQSFGEVRVADVLSSHLDGLNLPSGQVSQRIVGTENDFGGAVSWTPTGIALVASPSKSVVTAYRLLASGSSEMVYRIQPPENRSNFGSGFGTRILTISIPRKDSESPYAVLVAAPFEYIPKKGPNVGVVYVYCANESLRRSDSVLTPLEGPEAYSYFGYSIARVGDVDGDGLEDVAIAAPGIQMIENADSRLTGKVFIYRMASDCEIDPKPIQVIESPTAYPGDGFGLSLFGEFDLDNDGWPELVATSLSVGKAPYLFTMPRRLLVQCQIQVSPIYLLTQFQAGTDIPFELNVRLVDPKKQQWMEIPEGLASMSARVHQINPDQLWHALHLSENMTNTRDPVEVFMTSIVEGGLDPTVPRFQLIPNSLLINIPKQDPKRLLIRATLRAAYPASALDLTAIPLKIAYRSTINSTFCRATDNVCLKAQQPLVDWSKCEAHLKLATPICVPAPECRSDLSLQAVDGFNTSNTLIPILWGSFEHRHHKLTFRLTNFGPTKASGVKIQIKTTGRFQEYGLHVFITSVKLSQIDQTVNDSMEKEANKAFKWIKNIAENGLAVLILSKPMEWFYPNEQLHVELSIFLGESTQGDPHNFERLDAVPSNDILPGLAVRAFTKTTDPAASNNYLFAAFGVIYEPKLHISAASQPVSVIDNRDNSISFAEATTLRKLFAGDIGPKLTHTYLIENTGQADLFNLSFELFVPAVLQTADHRTLIYMAEEVKAMSGSTKDLTWVGALPSFIGSDGSRVNMCTPNSPTFINPLNLTILDVKREEMNPMSRRRIKRSLSDIVISRIEEDVDPSMFREQSFGYSPHILQKMNHGRIFIQCPRFSDGKNATHHIQCISFNCHLNRLLKHDTIRLQWIGWLWADTFFKLRKPDIQVTSQLRLKHWGELPHAIRFYQHMSKHDEVVDEVVKVKFPEPAPYLELRQSILFRNIQSDISHKFPIWPIVFGIVIGIIFLSILGGICYCCGFFRRSGNRALHIVHPPYLRSRSSSKTNLLSECNQLSGVRPSILTATPVQSLDARPLRQTYTNGKHRPKGHPGYLVPKSPNLYCAVEPEPPSPNMCKSLHEQIKRKIPASEQNQEQHHESLRYETVADRAYSLPSLSFFFDNVHSEQDEESEKDLDSWSRNPECGDDLGEVNTSDGTENTPSTYFSLQSYPKTDLQ